MIIGCLIYIAANIIYFLSLQNIVNINRNICNLVNLTPIYRQYTSNPRCNYNTSHGIVICAGIIHSYYERSVHTYGWYNSFSY